MNKNLILTLLMLPLLASAADNREPYALSTAQLAKSFSEPPMQYRPYVWWHWMGSNFSKEGIRRDLEAMKEEGIAGATIFNLTSAVQESHRPVGNCPWPEQTYRSDAYWEAIRYAAEVALRLGLKIGMNNSPGYTCTGGPWITQEQGMQKVVFTKSDVEGGRRIKVTLPQPDYPSYTDYSGLTLQASFYEDIAVMAVPQNGNLGRADVIDLTDRMKPDGQLEWDAPQGQWHIYRIGHAPTMSTPHPLPDEIVGKSFETDKFSAEIAAYHWDNVLTPLKEHVGDYFGKSFTYILMDSYEAGSQDWSQGFRQRFRQMHGYDPEPMIALNDAEPDNPLSQQFREHRSATVARMFVEGAWQTARQKISDAGLKMYWEPYSGPFNTEECIPIPDMPMNEFWADSDGRIDASFIDTANRAGKRIVGAEAFTAWPQISRYTEDPAFLKRSADGAFVSGINMLFLHHWVHQPFDDRYQPGMGMGWWGTHFGRNQTWFHPGKAFMTYLARCQMMLQQGTLAEHGGNQIHRQTADADIYFLVNQTAHPTTEQIKCGRTNVRPELWDPYTGHITYAGGPGVKSDEGGALSVNLRPGQSMFVVFNRGRSSYPRQNAYTPTRQIIRPVSETWDVAFRPKLCEPFSISDFRLMDFSQSSDDRIRYFAGTASYTHQIELQKADLAPGRRILLQLGELNDIAELWVNKKRVAVLWYPPYEADITSYLHRGANTLCIEVTNNWANRLIGDEQYEPDFEWGMDRGVELGRALKAFPDWFVKNEPRPSKNRKTFVIWSYYRQDSPLQPAGLVGPVNLILQETE